MMHFLRSILDLLEKAGVNTTRMKWKLFQWEKRWENRSAQSLVPTRLRWLQWQHKTCFRCGALVDRTATTCPKCGSRVSSVVVYRIRRLLGVVAPESAPAVAMIFLAAMWLVFAGTIAMQGASAFMRPTELTLEVFGAWSPILILRYHQFWRYLTFGIMHIGIIHIGFNSFALTQVGPLVENMVGKMRMLVIITVTQITSACATYLWYHNMHSYDQAVTAGASGWLFGVIGFGIAALWNQVGAARAYRDALIQWSIYTLIFGYFIHANNAAHVGGLLGGFALGIIPERGGRASRMSDQVWTGAAVVSGILWIVCGAFLILFIASHWTPGGVVQPGFE